MTEAQKEERGLALPAEGIVGLPDRFQPRNLTELMSWSKLIVASGLAPKGMNESAVVLAVQMGAELSITPTQALQNIAVINGRPSIWGDLGKAIFERDADYETFEERPPDEAKAQGEGWCRIAMKDGSVVERRFSREDAKTANLYQRSGPTGPWTCYEGRMLQMRARWWAMRDAAAHVFKGLHPREDAEEIRDVTAETTIRRPERKAEAGDGVEPKVVEDFLRNQDRPAPAPRPTPSQGPSGPSAPQASPTGERLISEPQRKRLYALQRKAGKTDDEVKEYLYSVHNIGSSAQIPVRLYDEICSWAEDPSTNIGG